MGGEDLLRGRLTVKPGGSGPPLHVHPRPEEWCEVEAGEVAVHLGDEIRVLSPGERITIPPETAHGFTSSVVPGPQ